MAARSPLAVKRRSNQCKAARMVVQRGKPAMPSAMRRSAACASRSAAGAARREGHVLLGASAADGLRIAEARLHEALLLEAAQRAVDGAERCPATCAFGQRVPNRDAVGVVAEPGERQQNQLLELAKVIRHASIYCTMNTKSRKRYERGSGGEPR